MRQAGVIAAPGIVALETMVERLREDHDNARLLAEALSRIKGLRIDLETVQTNIVMIDVEPLGVDAAGFIPRLEKLGVKASNYGGAKVRMVTHRGIEREDVEYAISAMEEAVNSLSA